MKCKKCKKEHDGEFGSGKFCSTSCAHSRIHTKETNEKRRRKLNYNEIVHHKNNNHKDNRLKNLKLMTRSEHTTYHNNIKNLDKENRTLT